MYQYYYLHNKSNAWSKVLSEKRKFLIVNICTSVTNSVSAVLSLCYVISVVYYTYYTKNSESLGIPTVNQELEHRIQLTAFILTLYKTV